MRRFSFITLGLTLALSVVAEILFYVVFIFCGSANQPNWLSQTFACFHYPATFLMFGWIAPDTGVAWQAILWVLIFFSVAVFEWWLIILAAIWSVRYFRRKSA